MTDQHPITPPPELVQQWWEQADQYQDDPKTYFDFIVTEVAQWGADQELKAVCQLLFSDPSVTYTLSDIRAARRPKPPTLKEQALEQLDGIATVFRMTHGGNIVCDKILAALEALPE
jgi:hypothetical protein